MLEKLFSSRVRAKVLATFFLAPGASFNAWSLSQKLSENYSAVWKELNRLESLDILNSEQTGNSKSYSINPSCPIISELRSIVLKTEGIGLVIREKLKHQNNIKEAFIYGSYAAGDADRHSDLDLMIIGEMSLDDISSMISSVEDNLNRPINYVIYPENEWNEKLNQGDAFASNVHNAPKIYLIGGE
jgi:predicted nucleotidyltransferase